MSTTQLPRSERTRPLVAVVCAVPLLGEAMSAALEFADVQTFAASGGDLDGLVRWLRPDALVVDNPASAADAAVLAHGHELPVLHVSVRDFALRLYRHGAWEVIGNGEGQTAEGIRNVVAGVLFAR